MRESRRTFCFSLTWHKEEKHMRHTYCRQIFPIHAPLGSNNREKTKFWSNYSFVIPLDPIVLVVVGKKRMFLMRIYFLTGRAGRDIGAPFFLGHQSPVILSWQVNGECTGRATETTTTTTSKWKWGRNGITITGSSREGTVWKSS